jgi:hypothetical protein
MLCAGMLEISRELNLTVHSLLSAFDVNRALADSSHGLCLRAGIGFTQQLDALLDIRVSSEKVSVIVNHNGERS